ncbi:MAG: PEP-CTERM sorting domain-containing protein [Candidatus Omnitrophica bacterium]|nr:PEP-CTERM sorting domain-containing protein [Candidatus Omnitrophota bacterium]
MFTKRKQLVFLSLAILLSTCLPSVFVYAAEYEITDLGTLSGGNTSVATGINNSGQVVGYSATRLDSYFSYNHAFLWENGIMKDLGTLADYESWAKGINNSGQVTGMSSMDIRGPLYAFSWENGTMRGLGTLGGNSSFGTGINDSGQVVGYSNIGNGYIHAFLQKNYTMIELSTLSNNNDTHSEAWGINNSGQIVGFSRAANNELHACLWEENRTIRDLGTLGDNNDSQAYGINDSGQVVGVSDGHAFLWENGEMKDLNGLLPVGSAWSLHQANKINGLGQIVGSGVINGQTHAFLMTPNVVPEPSTILMFLVGIFGCFWFKRK